MTIHYSAVALNAHGSLVHEHIRGEHMPIQADGFTTVADAEAHAPALFGQSTEVAAVVIRESRQKRSGTRWTAGPRVMIIPRPPAHEDWTTKDHIRAERFAAKWVAETDWRAAAGKSNEPTDDALTDTYAHCTRPPKARLYPLIREYLTQWSADDAEEPSGAPTGRS